MSHFLRNLFLGAALLIAAQRGAMADVVVDGGGDFSAAVNACLEMIAGTEPAGTLLACLEMSKQTVVISQNTGLGKAVFDKPDDAKLKPNGQPGAGSGTSVQWDPTFPYKYKDGVQRDPCAALFHELVHAKDAAEGKLDWSPGANGIGNLEIRACTEENKYRKAKGLPPRTKYGNKDLPDSAIPKSLLEIEGGFFNEN